jgi:hypothetical protein
MELNSKLCPKTVPGPCVSCKHIVHLRNGFLEPPVPVGVNQYVPNLAAKPPLELEASFPISGSLCLEAYNSASVGRGGRTSLGWLPEDHAELAIVVSENLEFLGISFFLTGILGSGIRRGCPVIWEYSDGAVVNER